MLFARDGTLFATVGDSDSLCCNGSEDNSERMRAQDLSTDFGKVLRIRDDGSIPPDNPFVNRPGARPEFFTDGKERVWPRLPSRHRPAVVLGDRAARRRRGQHPAAGAQLRMPLVSTGRNYTGTLGSDRSWFREGMDQPRMFWVPSISPSSLQFYKATVSKDGKTACFSGR